MTQDFHCTIYLSVMKYFFPNSGNSVVFLIFEVLLIKVLYPCVRSTAVCVFINLNNCDPFSMNQALTFSLLCKKTVK